VKVAAPAAVIAGGACITSSVLVAVELACVPSFTTQSMVRVGRVPPTVGSPLGVVKL